MDELRKIDAEVIPVTMKDAQLAVHTIRYMLSTYQTQELLTSMEADYMRTLSAAKERLEAALAAKAHREAGT